MKKIITTICLIATTALMLPVFGQTLTIQGGRDQQTSSLNGYDYELWSQNAAGRSSMTLTGNNTNGGTFTCEWQGTINILARSGKKFRNNETVSSVGNIVIDFEATWSSIDNVKMLGVYGWGYYPQGQQPSGFTDEIEYYIIQDRGSYNSATSGTNSRKRGEATIDGILYEFYTCERRNQPSLSGTSTFMQYFSVPKSTGSHRTKGIITVSKHFAEWAKVGMPMNKLYEVAMKVESYTGNTGNARGEAKVTKNILTLGGTLPDPNAFTLTTTASPAAGGTLTKTPNTASYTKGAVVQVTAVPNGGWEFNGWSEDASGTNATTSVTMNADKKVTANFKLVGVSTFNLIKDGNFPANSIGSSWALNTGTNYGNSAATSSINGGRATINVTRIGAEAYQPQLIQKEIALDKGMKYRLTFTASATAARSMGVMFQKATAEYDSYAAKDFELTTTPQTYTLEFEMENTSDPAAQFAFNLGGAATGVTLSDVKLVHIAEFTPAKKVTLTFDVNGGTMTGVNSISIEQGAAVGTLPVPIRAGYSFEGWFNGNVEYTAETKLTADVTITASWKEIEDLSELIEEVANLQKQIDALISETEDIQQLLDECK
ncbi:MAG: glycoside hydrolase family 11 protein [Prevotellaceae bacterium]|jgi:uncharacterized repeat protein (TIGR02543 family)|nr:glycoside hydrolase family 11 protein [Prevotellaceae bacterium]